MDKRSRYGTSVKPLAPPTCCQKSRITCANAVVTWAAVLLLVSLLGFENVAWRSRAFFTNAQEQQAQQTNSSGSENSEECEIDSSTGATICPPPKQVHQEESDEDDDQGDDDASDSWATSKGVTILHTCKDDPTVDCEALYDENDGKGCARDAEYSRRHCPATCHYCHLISSNITSQKSDEEATYHRVQLRLMVSNGEMKNAPERVLTVTVPTSYGVDQRVSLSPPNASAALSSDPERFDNESALVLKQLRDTHDYMWNTVYADTDSFDDFLRQECRNKHPDCTLWAALGECEANPAYMKTTCAPACRTCLLLRFDHRCPYNASDPDAPKSVWTKPSDIDTTFERILALYGENVTVLSRPLGNSTIEGSAASTIIDGPWVVTVDNFLSQHECDRLIQLGHDAGYKRSEDVGELKPDGTYEGVQSDERTSTTAWCSDT
jgi:ShK domain-like